MFWNPLSEDLGIGGHENVCILGRIRTHPRFSWGAFRNTVLRLVHRLVRDRKMIGLGVCYFSESGSVDIEGALCWKPLRTGYGLLSSPKHDSACHEVLRTTFFPFCGTSFGNHATVLSEFQRRLFSAFCIRWLVLL